MELWGRNAFYYRYWSGLKSFLASLGWFGLTGVVVALVMAWSFAELSESILENEWSKLDSNIQWWVHGFESPFLDRFFAFFTTIGGIEGTLIITAVLAGLLAWKKLFGLAVFLVITVGGGVALNELFKEFFHRARPQLWDISAAGIQRPLSYSYPSGHSTASLCLFGVLACLGVIYFNSWWRWPWAVLMGFIILMVGLSRIYFGVHYPTDVAGGYIVGIFWLASMMAGLLRHRHKTRRENPVNASVDPVRPSG